eukprot:TRINITY_DN52367_c0_g1_i1.p1 TRINITY_DN52367_c0_g1~~TRINITY_DN52367_c0_g1_i1.p1  ORF type:complete len:369 (-),score=27.70 TRINITY_DN52367_c0_g1_i1:154-1098(-)
MTRSDALATLALTFGFSSALTLFSRRSPSVSVPLPTDRLDVERETLDLLDGQEIQTWPGLNYFEFGVAVIVPGFGNESRAPLVQANIAWLRQQRVPIECTIFVYKSEEEFPLDPELYQPCELVRHAGYWMQHIAAYNLAKTRKQFILHLMDGIGVNPGADLWRMIAIMLQNELDMLSLSYRVSMQKWPIPGMSQNTSFEVGRLVDKVEFHFNVFTRASFACFQDLIDAESNPLGWGTPNVFPSVCHAKIGLSDSMTFDKLSGGAYDTGKALAQEKTYMTKFADFVPDGAWVPGAATIRGLVGGSNMPQHEWHEE